MQISVTSSSKGLNRMLERLTKIERNIDSTLVSELTPVKDKGVKQLKDATPVDSGKTRESWDGSVEKVAKGLEIIFSNSNKTKTNIPIPILIRNGHVTGTGGYVPPNDFMTPVIKSIVKESSEKVKKVMTSGK